MPWRYLVPSELSLAGMLHLHDKAECESTGVEWSWVSCSVSEILSDGKDKSNIVPSEAKLLLRVV